MTVHGRGRGQQVREAPRVRDMPAPRKNESAAGGAMQRVFAWPYRGILAFLIWTGVRPWQLTLLSLALNVVTGVLIVTGAWLAAGGVLILAGACDVFDGSVARHRGEAKRAGAFMDSVLDRVSDMILFSCLFWRLAADGRGFEAALALVTLIVSLVVSHIRAEAEAAGVLLSDGLFQRLERVLALIVGLVIPGAMLPVLVLLAVLGTVTVVQRVYSALRGA
ncbi:MAG: CDP-alcohol phosphatidyltransferase family protein [Actinobacteria bacterium]|nr:MAG: CDP-alcohol phosphatidyltransferase family protein [Actinomycetota bacterium]